MPIRKKIGLVKAVNKTGRKSVKVLVHKEHPAETITIPGNISKLVILGYPQDHPMANYNVDFIRMDEQIWSRGFGDTIEEALKNAKPMSKQRPRETPRNSVALAYNNGTSTTEHTDRANSQEKEKAGSKATAGKPIRKLTRIRKPG